MAITLRKRSRSRRAAPLDAATLSECAAMTTLAETLHRLAAELPPESPLAAEFAAVARSIDVAGVLGTWRLESLVRELAPAE